VIEKFFATLLIKILDKILASGWKLGKEIIARHKAHGRIDKQVELLEKEVMDPSLSPTQLKRIKDAGRALIRDYRTFDGV